MSFFLSSFCHLFPGSLVLISLFLVPIWDLREYTLGDEEINWQHIMTDAPKLTADQLPTSSIIGVFHTIGNWVKTTEAGPLPAINLNLFGIVVLASSRFDWKGKGASRA